MNKNKIYLNPVIKTYRCKIPIRENEITYNTITQSNHKISINENGSLYRQYNISRKTPIIRNKTQYFNPDSQNMY